MGNMGKPYYNLFRVSKFNRFINKKIKIVLPPVLKHTIRSERKYKMCLFIQIRDRFSTSQFCANISKTTKNKTELPKSPKTLRAVETLSTATRPFSILFKIYVTCLSLLAVVKSENAK